MIVVCVEKLRDAYECPETKAVTAASRPPGETRTRLGRPLNLTAQPRLSCSSNMTASNVGNKPPWDVRQTPFTPATCTRSQESPVEYRTRSNASSDATLSV